MCSSRFHFPVPLGSTGISRFIATMGTLTPVLLLPAPEQVSLVHQRALPDIPSPTTPCASAPAMLRLPGRLGPRFALGAIGGCSSVPLQPHSRPWHLSPATLSGGRVFLPPPARSISTYPRLSP